MRRKVNPSKKLFSKKKKLIPLNKLKKKAELVFHRWIVKRDKRICYTCGKEGNQAGHFRHNRLDFDENNLHCQCTYCNMYQSGNLAKYAIRLIDEIGREKVDWMMSQNKPQKYTREELNEIIKKYS